MRVVVDTNIIFSALISPKGTISDLLFNFNDRFHFLSPELLLEEMERHQDKLIRLSKLSVTEILRLQNVLIKRIDLVDLASISDENWNNAKDLVRDIDSFDFPFVALTLEKNATLWTGDKKLVAGLRGKGFQKVVNSQELLEIGLKNRID